MREKQRLTDLGERSGTSRVQTECHELFIGQMVTAPSVSILDGVEDGLGLIDPSVDHQPSRRFGN
jgi:hypothetical protein